MALLSLSRFLDNLKSLVDGKSMVISVVADVIKQKTNIKVPPENISISSGKIYLKVHPLMKGEIYMKKESIIEEIKKIVGSEKISSFS